MSFFSSLLTATRGQHIRRFAVALIAAVTLAIGSAGPSSASKYAAHVVDAKTGKVLFSSSADAPRYPASLTKMMTLYMAFDAMKSGRISKSTRVPVSRNAANMAPSKLGLRAGQTISVEEAIYALVTKSANDAACALGELLGGSEARFADMMTSKARRIGMSSTTFRNASGLPDPRQRTTARDMATLGIALREHFPQYYGYFKTGSFRFRGRRHANHNKLLGRVAGVDGIKTGYTRASGFNLVSSVDNGGRRIVAVVMGGKSGRARDAHMAGLIKQFLPKASKSASGPLLAARPASDPVEVASVETEEPRPAPAARPEEQAESVVSGLAAAEDEQVAEEETASGDEEIAEQAPEAVVLAEKPVVNKARETAVVPVARPAEEVAEAKAETKAQSKAEAKTEAKDVDPIVTATPEPTGWVIQVGSLPSQDQANDFLAKAKEQGGALLASAKPFTEVFQKGSATYYRARFGGYASQDDARDACASLKKKKIACYAVAN